MSDVYFFTDTKDYEVVSDGESMCRIHQLLACLDHDPAKVFSNGEYHTHHETGYKRDNRPESVSLLPTADHMNLHHQGEWTEIGGEPRLEVSA